MWFSDVIGGIVSGVCAGLILAGFFALHDSMRAAAERRDQIAYFRSLVSDAGRSDCWDGEGERMAKTLAKVALAIAGSDGSDASHAWQEAAQLIRFRHFQEELIAALRGRASRLNFDQVRELEKKIVPREVLKSLDGRLSRLACMRYLDSFEEVSWIQEAEGR